MTNYEKRSVTVVQATIHIPTNTHSIEHDVELDGLWQLPQRDRLIIVTDDTITALAHDETAAMMAAQLRYYRLLQAQGVDEAVILTRLSNLERRKAA